jgi:hypothetical protein
LGIVIPETIDALPRWLEAKRTRGTGAKTNAALGIRRPLA